MKIHRFEVFLFFAIISSFIIISCTPPTPQPPANWISFKIKGVNISDASDYLLLGSDPEINLFKFSIGSYSETKKIFDPYIFALSHPVSYNSKKFSLSGLDTNKEYSYIVNRDAVSIIENDETTNKSIYRFNLYDFCYTKFIKKDGNWERNIYDIYPGLPYSNNKEAFILSSGTHNELKLTYNIRGYSAYNVEVLFDNEKVTINDLHSGLKAFNYGAEWRELVHGYNGNTPDPDSMLNIVIMGDYYLNNEMLLYMSQVNDMVQNLWKNKFFSYNGHKEKINIFCLNTVSLPLNQTGTQTLGIIGVTNNTPFGDTDRIKRIIETSFTGSDVNLDNIDAIVVLLKNGTRNYSQIYDGEFTRQNKQPTNIIVTNGGKLSHLLGHALACLHDEAFSTCEYLMFSDISYSYENYYKKNYRNVSSERDGLKWSKFMDKGYPTSSTYGAVNGLGTISNPFMKKIYGSDSLYYIPTNQSTMGAPTNVTNNSQFGPVNFYHLRASFLIRTGILKNDSAKDQLYIDDKNSYEWQGYSIDNFINDGFETNYFLDN
jgi:hypothetical protein